MEMKIIDNLEDSYRYSEISPFEDSALESINIWIQILVHGVSKKRGSVASSYQDR